MSPLTLQKLRISVKAYEPTILDNACVKIVDAIKASGIEAVGPIPLPTKLRRYCVLTSPHVNKKARDHFRSREYNIISEYLDFWNELSFDHAIQYGKEIVDRFVSGEADHVQVVYNEFVSVATQTVISEQLLPLEYDQEEQKAEDKIFEPSKDEIVLNLIPRHLNVQVWKYLLESYASEQAARMLAMENATTNAQDMIRDLTLEFNKARQTAITMEILDIVGGAEALK